MIPSSFAQIPGSPFAYWAHKETIELFNTFKPFEGERRFARQGGVTGNDFRWVRAWWEVRENSSIAGKDWRQFAKGGARSLYYSDIYLVVSWDLKRKTFWSFNGLPHRPSLQPASFLFYFRQGLTWPLRTQKGLALRIMPQGCVFGHKGPAAFIDENDPQKLLALLAVTNSSPFRYLVELQMCFGSYEVGVVQRTPVPDFSTNDQELLAALARRAWSLKRRLDTVNETSHAFILPAALLSRVMKCGFDPAALETEITKIQQEINEIVFRLYCLDGESRTTILAWDQYAEVQPTTTSLVSITGGEAVGDDDAEDADDTAVDHTEALLSWAAGVAFGRFDIRFATSERIVPIEPEPFDPLPARSSGMLSDGDALFHVNPGILTDDPGHLHDLSDLVETIQDRVEVEVPTDARTWLRRDFFPLHLKRYSKSPRKAPIYWPISTASGSYTLWLYYPALTSQTLLHRRQRFRC